jgi:hypothetical protein
VDSQKIKGSSTPKLETCQTQVHILALTNGFTSPEVFGISRQLDEKINEYFSLKNNLVNK